MLCEEVRACIILSPEHSFDIISQIYRNWYRLQSLNYIDDSPTLWWKNNFLLEKNNFLIFWEQNKFLLEKNNFILEQNKFLLENNNFLLEVVLSAVDWLLKWFSQIML